MSEKASKKPVANPTAAVPAILFALVLIGAGVVLGREALLNLGAIDGPEWVGPAATSLDGLTAQPWMLPGGIAAVVVGFVLVIAALRPRRRTHRALSEQDVWLRKGDIATVARTAALDSVGVDSATAKAGNKKVTVAVATVAGTDTAELKSSVVTSVDDALRPLASAPKVRTRVRTTGQAS
ncbi:hypothetical protein CH296_08975 [Rhodococcus sp. 14-2496-1d]|uniref:DUF6286 domain-containing protein n=1 Tax=Rhodococcus sp. 14-2496-1d TaxID=2023146 RepID=UPI000B9B95A0|nr:DUF6286 domain-containing protein [Rhodococcus sp. 14-2496-1d]OZF34782.1 hypothetical protein CH296_08975 [Rhodococcus sp. 14-2496-1d]